jgi:hypothetical protein
VDSPLALVYEMLTVLLVARTGGLLLMVAALPVCFDSVPVRLCLIPAVVSGSSGGACLFYYQPHCKKRCGQYRTVNTAPEAKPVSTHGLTGAGWLIAAAGVTVTGYDSCAGE